MTNREILAELKRCYEYLYDITENGNQAHCGGQLGQDIINKIRNAINDVSSAYYDVYRELDKKEVEVDYYKDGEPYFAGYISDDIGYDYMWHDDNGDEEYCSHADIDEYCWYLDEEYLDADIDEE